MTPGKLRVTRDVSVAELNQRYRHEQNPRVKMRLQMLLRIQDGASARQVAREHHCSHATVARWVHRFNKHGFDGLADQPRSGRPPEVTPEQLEQVLAQPPAHYGYPLPAWTPRAVRVLLDEHFGIKYRLASIYKVLRRCGFALIAPRPRHYRQRPKEVEAFKKK
jgi:transposase